MIPADAGVVRDLIARGWLGQADADRRLGEVVLHPHQAEAVGRIRGIIRQFGGALLCDAVGLGKTYVALAVAGDYGNPCIVAPASLRWMWGSASSAARVPVAFLSTESLSTKDLPRLQCGVVVVDEAHRFRNTKTARYSRLVSLTRDVPALLLSATPVHNRKADLLALLELFLGSSARSLSGDEVARVVVRRDVAGLPAVPAMPVVHAPVRITIGDDREMLGRIVELPPPLPPADGYPAPALATLTLLRLWASSDAALRAGLRSRLGRAAALRAALESGRHPTKSELFSWAYSEGAVQLGFADLLCSPRPGDPGEMLRALDAHESAVRDLSGIERPSLDGERAAALRGIRDRHAGAKIVAFTQFAETAAAFYREMKGLGGIGMLTGSGGRIATGRIPRRETIERFAPIANGVKPPPRSAAIDFLLTTDVLSEGVNLQDASVVVHLDLPWTATALEQRVGRVARLGSSHDRIFVYALEPPASAESLVRAESILRRKLATANNLLGRSRIPPLFSALCDAPSIVVAREHMWRILGSWLRDGSEDPSLEDALWACVSGETHGFIALVKISNRLELIAGAEDAITNDPFVVADVLAAAEGPSAECSDERARIATEQVARWLERERAREDAGSTSHANDSTRRKLFSQLSAVVRALPRHEQQRDAEVIADIRSALAGHLSAGIERDLDQLSREGLPPRAWLHRV